MTFPSPIRAFLLGVIVSELMQWGFWLRKNGGRVPLGYFKAQSATLIANMGINVGVCFLWSFQGLDGFLDWMSTVMPFIGAEQWAESGIPYTPQVGLMLGCMSDFFGDDIAYNLVEVVRKWLPGGRGSSNTPVPPANKEVP